MLPKKRRILRKEFTSILKGGKRFHSPSVVLCVVPTSPTGAPESKFSFSVSKKVCQRAVDRNKHRRRGYSVVSKNLKKIKKGYLCLFSLKKTDKPVIFSVLEKEIVGLLSDAGVLS